MPTPLSNLELLGQLAEQPGRVIDTGWPWQKQPDDIRHGTLTKYNRPHACRCPECVEAKRRYDETHAGQVRARTNRDLLAQATANPAPIPTEYRRPPDVAERGSPEHRAKTSASMRGRNVRPAPEHGTVARYNLQRDPCRCNDCRAAMREYGRKRRAA